MKLINKITSLFVLILLAGFAACTDEKKYTPAEKPTNAQVYFTTGLPSRVDLSKDITVTSYDIEMRRVDKSDALTVNLTVVNENLDLYTIPTSVSFAAGSDITKISITYDPEKLVYDDFKPVSITIDPSHTSPYGYASYAFTVGISAPWKSLGKATFTEDQFIVDSWEVELQQHEINPTRFRLVNAFDGRSQYYSNVIVNDQADDNLEFVILPAGGSYTTFNREDGTFTVTTTVEGLVFYEPTNIGMTYVGNGDLSIMHPVGRTLAGVDTRDEGYWLKNIVKQWSADGKPEVVQIAPLYAYAELNWSAHNYSQDDGVITIVFPGVELIEYDYSVSMNYLGHYIDLDDVDNAVVQFTKGSDVASYKYVIVNGALTPTSAEDIADEIINETIAAEEDTENSYKIFSITDAGKYSVVVVAFDKNGKSQDFAFITFEFIPAGMDDPWVSLGFCEYTDDVLIMLYTGDPDDIPTYDVEILEHKDKPGLFRLKNAYGADYPYNDPGDYDEGNVYIEINATDPDGVYIDYQSMGVDWGYGTHYIYSEASYYMDNGVSFAQVKEDGRCGTYKDDVITFPTKKLLITDDDGMYYANNAGKWKVDMTSLSKKTSKSTLATKSVSLKKSFVRSANQVKAPFKMKSNLPIRVKSKNVPASVIRTNVSVDLQLQ